jgi:2-dehydro-3-deoxyphosphogalactonate aldolase
MKWTEALATLPLVAILRGIETSEAAAVARALASAGFACVEVPLNSPDPFASIAAIKAGVGARMVVGAGTVLTPMDVQRAAEAGAELIVSPNTDISVIRATKQAGLASLPGFFTASEAFAAIGAGADALKLFPAEAAPPAALKALKAVLPANAPVLPVGGIDETRYGAYLAAGAAGFGLGGALYKPGMSADAVLARAKPLVESFRAQSLRPKG